MASEPELMQAQFSAAMAQLNDRQQLVVHGILEGKDQITAYTDAGYKNNRSNATRLITNDNFQEALRLGRLIREERTQITQDWVIERLVQNVERSMQAEPVRDKEGNPIGEYTYQGSVANRALELLGKNMGMFKDRLEVQMSGFNPNDYTYEQLLEIRERMQKKESLPDILATLGT